MVPALTDTSRFEDAAAASRREVIESPGAAGARSDPSMVFKYRKKYRRHYQDDNGQKRNEGTMIPDSGRRSAKEVSTLRIHVQTKGYQQQYEKAIQQGSDEGLLVPKFVGSSDVS